MVRLESTVLLTVFEATSVLVKIQESAGLVPGEPFGVQLVVPDQILATELVQI